MSKEEAVKEVLAKLLDGGREMSKLIDGNKLIEHLIRLDKE